MYMHVPGAAADTLGPLPPGESTSRNCSVFRNVVTTWPTLAAMLVSPLAGFPGTFPF